MKKRIAIVLALLSLLFCLASSALAESFTLMMYMCGSDLQEDCVRDMKEMMSAKTGKDINIVVLAGGAKSWPEKRLAANRLNLFTISGGKTSETIDWGKASMGSPDTLAKFINYSLDTCPADRTMLVMWNHGGGTESGVCFDDVHSDDSLTLVELQNTLRDLQKKRNLHLDIVGFDACLMAGYEAAATLSPFADYMIASEELEPSLGWYYTDWLAALSKNPSMDTETICENIVSAYKKACEKDDPDDFYTLSAIDLRRMPQLITQIESLSTYLADALENRQLNTISRMRQRVRSYGYWYDSSSDMIDLSSLLSICEQFAPTATQAARNALEDVVVVNYKSYMVDVASGLSTYVPMDTRREIKTILKGYSVDIIPNYVDFVKGYAALLNGGNYSFGMTTPSTVSSCTSSFISTFAFSSFIPGATYSAESSTSSSLSSPTSFVPGTWSASATAAPTAAPSSGTSFIAGILSDMTTAAPEATAAPSSGSSFIAGVLSDLSPQPTAQPAPQGSSFISTSLLGFVPGTQSSVVEAPPTVTEDSMAFSLTLSSDAIYNLSYAEGCLFVDASDEDGTFLVDFGRLHNTWIDWTTNTVYSLFDGSWPTLGDQFVVMFDQSKNEAFRRSIIPARVNGEKTYLVVSFAGDSQTGRVIGHNAGYAENGLPIRTTTPLKDGDEVIPLYVMYYQFSDEPNADMEEYEYEGDPFIWDSAMEVTYESLIDEEEPMDFLFSFRLNDIFGEHELSESIPFVM